MGNGSSPKEPKDDLEAETRKPRYSLQELLSQITPDNQPDSFDDAPVGEEML